MEFMNGGTRQSHASHATPSSAGSSGTSGSGGRKENNSTLFKGLRLASVALLFSATILVVALVWYMALREPATEAKYVQEDRMQAVFLNGGQVYFGNIESVNDEFMRMSNIFYLRVNRQVQPEQQGDNNQASENGISLVKLGCELHRPTNEMIINRDQVVFWENLKEDNAQNTVPGAVKQYLKQYPNGQECQDAAQQDTDSQANTEEQTGDETSTDSDTSQ